MLEENKKKLLIDCFINNKLLIKQKFTAEG